MHYARPGRPPVYLFIRTWLRQRRHDPDQPLAGDEERGARRVEEHAAGSREVVGGAVRAEVDREPREGELLVLHAGAGRRPEIESAHAAYAGADLEDVGARGVG